MLLIRPQKTTVNLNLGLHLFQGWSLFSTGATKLATKATESAIKVGGIATQKVAEIGVNVNDKVCFIHFIFICLLVYLFCFYSFHLGYVILCR